MSCVARYRLRVPGKLVESLNRKENKSFVRWKFEVENKIERPWASIASIESTLRTYPIERLSIRKNIGTRICKIVSGNFRYYFVLTSLLPFCKFYRSIIKLYRCSL